MGMKYRDPETGQFKDLKVKTSDTLPIGTQVAYGGTVPPTGWLICDGSAVSRTTYAELFKVIGTSYGAGDGSTTFNLPNKKGRVSAGYDSTNSKFNAIGKKLGEETHTLTVEELAEHNHNLAYLYDLTKGYKNAFIPATTVENPTNYTSDIKTIQNTGGNQPHNNIQPTEVDNWIIKAFQSIGVVGKVVNTKTNSDNDTYSCNYINSALEEHYSTEETFTGKYWIDGKKIYRKVVNMGYMPNSSSIDYDLQLSNVYIVNHYGAMYKDTEILPFNFYASTSSCLGILKINNNNVFFMVSPTSNRSAYKGTIIVEYTKTTE